MDYSEVSKNTDTVLLFEVKVGINNYQSIQKYHRCAKLMGFWTSTLTQCFHSPWHHSNDKTLRPSPSSPRNPEPLTPTQPLPYHLLSCPPLSNLIFQANLNLA